MLIPNQYLLEEGKDAPEGTVVKKCRICGKQFALPEDVAKQVGDTDICDADSCKEVADKEAAEAAHALMKSGVAAETEAVIKTALGN